MSDAQNPLQLTARPLKMPDGQYVIVMDATHGDVACAIRFRPDQVEQAAVAIPDILRGAYAQLTELLRAESGIVVAPPGMIIPPFAGNGHRG